MNYRDRPGDAEHELGVNRSLAEIQGLYRERQERMDAETVYLIVVTNTRTGAKLRSNTREQGGWYQTEDGLFLALQEDVESITHRWNMIGEAHTDLTAFSGREFRLAQERATRVMHADIKSGRHPLQSSM
jgi:hypothetical protein